MGFRILHQFGWTLVVLLLVGCSMRAEGKATPLSSTPTALSRRPTITATPAPTSTPVPPTAATSIASRGDQEWDLVVMGDSIMFDLGSRYSGHLERDLGIKVRIHDWTRGSCGSSCLLNYLRTSSELQQQIREAEIVIFDIGFKVFEGPAYTYGLGSPGQCGGPDNQDCLREALQMYQTETEAIFAELVSLRRPSEALIRTMDTYQFAVKELKAAGAFTVANTYWREANTHLIQVATKHHIPVAQTYAAFMGPKGDEDPRQKGLVQRDGIHPTEAGTDLIAELFRDLGYNYATLEP